MYLANRIPSASQTRVAKILGTPVNRGTGVYQSKFMYSQKINITGGGEEFSPSHCTGTG
jgi:hypothetical protein